MVAYMTRNRLTRSQRVKTHHGLKGKGALRDTEDRMASTGAEAFYVAFALYSISYWLSVTFLNTLIPESLIDLYTKICSLLCPILLFYKLCLQKAKPLQLLGVLLAGTVTIASFFVTRYTTYLMLFLFVMAAKNVSIKRLASTALVSTLIVTVLTMVCALTGLIESRYMVRTGAEGMVIRSSLGFTHPNQFGQAILTVCVSLAAMEFPKFKIWHLMPYSVAFWLCFDVANSQTSAVGVAFMTLVALITSLKRDDNSWQRKMALASLIVAVVAIGLSYYMMFAYSPSLPQMRTLDKLLSHRFSIAHQYYLSYPPTLLGRPNGTLRYVTSSFSQNGPDNGYVRILLQNGWLVAFMYVFAYLLTLAHLYKLGRYDACSFGLLVCAIIAITEPNAVTIVSNIYLVGLSSVLYGMDAYLAANTPQEIEAQVTGPKRRLSIHGGVRRELMG